MNIQPPNNNFYKNMKSDQDLQQSMVRHDINKVRNSNDQNLKSKSDVLEALFDASLDCCGDSQKLKTSYNNVL